MADTLNLALLIDNLDCSREDAQRLASLFSTSAATNLQKIEEGIASGNLEAIFKAAHSIKGSAGSLWLEGIQALALDIEMAARQDQPFDYTAAYAELSRRISELRVVG